MVEGAGDEVEERDEEERPSATRSSDKPRPQPATGRPPRPSFLASFRSSFRPIDLRSDIRALPGLLRTKAFLIPVILSGLSVALVPLLGLNASTYTFYQYFSGAAPLGTAFISGFFAPRSSYLLGGLVGLASAGFQALAFTGQGNFGGLLEIVPDPATGVPLSRAAAATALLEQALFVGVFWCGFFAAAAAWYRRFLRMASPARQAQAQAATSRRPDGRVPKRNQGRPMLARRR